MKTLKDFQEAIDQCVRCGACQAHCPVYLETGQEGSVARGKIVLAASLLTGAAELNEKMRKEMSLCLLCGSCVIKCPNRVPTDAIVGALRRQITTDHGLSAVGKGVAALTGSKSLLKTLVKGANLLTPFLFTKIPETSGLRLRFAPESLKMRSLPPIPQHSLFDRVPEFLEGEPGKETVGIFAGCALTYLYPEVGELLVKLPHHLGFSVFTPKTQACCGMPAFSSGNTHLMTTLYDKNTRAFAGHPMRYVLTACASCLGMLHTHPAGDAPLAENELLDIHVFLHRQGMTDQLARLPRWQERIRITYHDPCHLRGVGVTREPRELLQALPQVEFIDMEDAELCCGLGGTFAVTHPDLSRAIGDRKLDGIKKSGASLLASSCPGCILQLQDTVNRAGLSIKVVHTLELIHQAFAVEPQ